MALALCLWVCSGFLLDNPELRNRRRFESRIHSLSREQKTLYGTLRSSYKQTEEATKPATVDEERELELASYAQKAGSQVQWVQRVHTKLACIREGFGAFYLLHMRKAAGTTTREMISSSFSRDLRHIKPFYETEGKSVSPMFFQNYGGINPTDGAGSLLTVTSLRDPISRILSLYWYLCCVTIMIFKVNFYLLL